MYAGVSFEVSPVDHVSKNKDIYFKKSIKMNYLLACYAII